MQADTPKPWRVEVIEDDTQEVVKTIRCHTEREAQRVERGLLVNLNHKRFHTNIVPPQEAQIHD